MTYFATARPPCIWVELIAEEYSMALKSKYPDFLIPDNVSWPQYVYQTFDKYGDKTAIVSIPFEFPYFIDH